MIQRKRGLLPTWLASAHRRPVYTLVDANSRFSAIEMSNFSKSVVLAPKVHLSLVLTSKPSSTPDQNSFASTSVNQYSSHKDSNKALPRPPSRIHFVRHWLMSLYYHRLRKLEGYHFGVLCCAMVAAVVLIINLILTIWVVSKSGLQNGLGTLQDGSCKRTATLTSWIHLAINVLSTLLLGASNYSMQCLSSPTRDEIDKAHGQGVWLDVGVPSVRNLRRLSTTRIVLWWLLAISSVPLHLLYNSAVFSSLCTRRYNVFLMSSEFLDGGPLNFPIGIDAAPPNLTTTVQDYKTNQTSLEKLENEICVKTYTAPIISTNSDLLLISDFSDPTNSLLYWDRGQDSQLIVDSEYNDTGGFCSLPFLRNCDPSGVIANPKNWSIDISDAIPNYFTSTTPDNEADGPVFEPLISFLNGTRIQYCLSQPVEEHCKLQFSLAIMIVVIVCNLIKTSCMGMIAWKQDPEPLVTLGDAIASFLERPDVTSRGNCIVGKTLFEHSRTWGLHLSRWDPRRLRWFRAASQRRWLVSNTL